MKSKSKKITGWSVFALVVCLNTYFGIGIWTPFTILGAAMLIPPVFKFIYKNAKIKKASVAAVASLLIVVGAVSWGVKGDKEVLSEFLSENETTYTQSESTSKTTKKAAVDIDYSESFSIDSIPKYSKEPFVVINDNVPDFDKNTKAKAFEEYAPLDKYGRCGAAYACVCQETMPTEKRGDIHTVKPSGWQHVEYDFVDGKSLYNRCHLIGFQLTAENANARNLITGTRYMNVDGMLPFENMVSDYVKETNNHVLYRVTPIFKKNELVARGVQMEAYSIEDKGEGICYNVFCYNVQPGVKINYKDGTSTLAAASKTTTAVQGLKKDYVLNVKSHKFHNPDCSGLANMNSENKTKIKGTREELINKGYSPCSACNP